MADALQIGQSLPELSAQTPDGKATTVQAHLGPQKTLLYFLHGTWCPECVSQLYRLQRYRCEIVQAGGDVLVVTRDAPETLAAFLMSALPPLEYTMLADPEHMTGQAMGMENDTLAVIVDSGGIVRWFARWGDHRERLGFPAVLQVLREVADTSIPAETMSVSSEMG